MSIRNLFHAVIPGIFLAAAWGDCLGNQQFSFQGLGFLYDDTYSRPYDISDDGRYVIGYSSVPVSRTNPRLEQRPNLIFLWNKENGMRDLQDVTQTKLMFSPIISGDGSTFFGRDTSQWYSWNIQRGLQPIDESSHLEGIQNVSTNGDVVTGSNRSSMSLIFDALAVDKIHGGTLLHAINEPFVTSTTINRMSSNGSVFAGGYKSYTAGSPGEIVHSASLQSEQAYIWTRETGLRPLGFLSDTHNRSTVSGLSADGKVVVGTSSYVSTPMNIFSPGSEAYIWDEQNGLRGIGLLPECTNNYATAVSADGRVVIGSCRKNSEPALIGVQEGISVIELGLEEEAFVWDAKNNTRSLGCLPGYKRSIAKFLSDDGSLIFGYCSNFPFLPLINETRGSHDIFVWTELTGMQSLENILTANGVYLDGWSLDYITNISADGHTITGCGLNPSGLTEGWIVTIPEPATLTLLALAGMIVLRQKKKNS
jgi:uncharacterized membrane protein